MCMLNVNITKYIKQMSRKGYFPHVDFLSFRKNQGHFSLHWGTNLALGKYFVSCWFSCIYAPQLKTNWTIISVRLVKPMLLFRRFGRDSDWEEIIYSWKIPLVWELWEIISGTILFKMIFNAFHALCNILSIYFFIGHDSVTFLWLWSERLTFKLLQNEY